MWGTGPQNEATSDLVFAAKLRLNEGFWDLPPGSVLDPLKGDALGQGSGEKRDPNDAHDAFRPGPRTLMMFSSSALDLGPGGLVSVFSLKRTRLASFGRAMVMEFLGEGDKEREREMCVYIYIEKLYNIQIYIYTHMYIYICTYLYIYINMKGSKQP